MHTPLVGKPIWLKPENIGDGWQLLGKQRLGAAAASVRFDFPTAYKTLWLIAQAVKDGTAGAVHIQLNGAGGTAYDYQDLTGDSTTVNGARATGQAQIVLTTGETIDNDTAALFSALITKQQTGNSALLSSLGVYTHTTTPALNIEATAGVWVNTDALMSRLDVLASATNFAANSIFLLMGSKEEG